VCSALPRKEPWQTKQKSDTYRTGTGDFFSPKSAWSRTLSMKKGEKAQ